MGEKRIRRSKELKFKVALETIRGAKQLAQIADEYHIHPQQVTQWKKELLEKGPELFAAHTERDSKRLDAEREDLLKTIGHQQVIIDWFTYIRLARGFVYLVAILDWYSRKVLAWELSITADQYFVIYAPEEARRRHGDPQVFNTDQGSQFTCPGFVEPLIAAGVQGYALAWTARGER